MNCIICGSPDAPHQAPSRLNLEDSLTVTGYYASFQDEKGNPAYHTGHLRTDLMELSARVCYEHIGPILPQRAPETPGWTLLRCTQCKSEWLAPCANHGAVHTPSECESIQKANEPLFAQARERGAWRT